MIYERPIYQINPFEILWRTADAKGDWGGWKVHSKHWSEDERDQEYAKVSAKNTVWRQYKKHDNEFELNLQREEGRRSGYDHNAVI